LCSESSEPPGRITHSKQIAPGCQALCQPWACYCIFSDPQAMELILPREGGATNHHALHCLSSHLLKLLSGSISTFSLSTTTSHAVYYPVAGYQDLRSHSCSLALSPQTSSISNTTWQQVPESSRPILELLHSICHGLGALLPL
jgi:hypothetical protein